MLYRAQTRVMPGEARHDALAEVRQVEVDARRLGGREVRDDRAAHDVARRELARGVVLEREPLALLVDQPPALAADGLGDQVARGAGDVQRRRVELDELEVAEPGARAERHAETVAGRDLGIGRLAVHAARPSGREDRAPGEHEVRARGGP